MARHDGFRSAADELLKIVREGRRFVAEDRYVLVFGLIMLTILANTFLAEDFPIGRELTLGLLIVTMLVTLSTSNAGPRLRWVGGATAVIAAVGVVLAAVLGYTGVERLAFDITMIVLAVITPVVIARRIAAHPKVTLQTVSGAADIYLLIGLLFSVVFGVVGMVQAGVLSNLSGVSHATAASAFFHSTRPVTSADFLYYSFVTLTTVGYGDVTAAGEFGRMLSIVEALFGQLYLVTVIALIVSNIGSQRTTRGIGGGGSSRESSGEEQTPA